MMHMLVLLASPHQGGNTEHLVIPFMDTWIKAGHTAELIRLYDCCLKPCLACRFCQKDWTRPVCVQKDDALKIAGKVQQSDLLLLASPIYSWYCTPPMKALLDRFVYMFNKYYGDQGIGPSLWAGKSLALLTTCGYPVEKGADLWVEGVKRYCHHSRLTYLGAIAERQRKYGEPFMDQEKEARIRKFAQTIMDTMQAT